MKRQLDVAAAKMLKVHRFNAELSISVLVHSDRTVVSLKKAAAKDLGIPWWQQHWTPVKEGGSLLSNDFVLDVSKVPEVTCVTVHEPYFCLDHGKFNHLLVTGFVGEPITGQPQESGRLVVAGEDTEGYTIDDAVALEERFLIIKGDGQCEEDDPWTTAAWSEEVLLDADNAPILVGWRVRYISAGYDGPSFGLTTRYHLTAGAGNHDPTGLLVFCPSVGGVESALICHPTSFKIGSEVEKINGVWIMGWPGIVTGVQDGKLSIQHTDDDDEKRQLDGVDARCVSGPAVKLTCTSSPSVGAGELAIPPPNSAGGVEYDVLVVFDSAKKEVRASVGWGGPGSRTDKVLVPAEMWPSPDLPLVPFVTLAHQDFNGINNVADCEEQLPITIEALTKNQIPAEAIHALMH